MKRIMDDWQRDTYPRWPALDSADIRLHRIGLHLSTDHERGGYWLVSARGSQYFPTWQAAWDAACAGTAAVMQMPKGKAE